MKKVLDTIYNGSLGAANLARIHSLQTPQKTPKKKHKEREMAAKHLRKAMLSE